MSERDPWYSDWMKNCDCEEPRWMPCFEFFDNDQGRCLYCDHPPQCHKSDQP